MDTTKPASTKPSAHTKPIFKTPPGFDRETELISKRRTAAGFDNGGLDPAGKPVIGVALSGGGIRSATFCLGLFQSLASHHLLRHVDYLSTVSGGGYFGGFLGRMFTRDWVVNPPQDIQQTPAAPPSHAVHLLQPAAPPPKPTTPAGDPRGHRQFDREKFLDQLRGGPLPQKLTSDVSGTPQVDLPQKQDAISRVEIALAESQSPPLVWLRDSGCYLAPGGAKDAALDAAIYLRNWLSILVVMLTMAFTLFLAFNCFRFCILRWSWLETTLANHAGPHLWWTPAVALPILVAAVALVPLGMAYWLTQPAWQRYAAWAAYGLVVFAGADAFWHLTGCWPPTGTLRAAVVVLGAITLCAILWCSGLGVGSWVEHSEVSSLWIRNRLSDWLRLALLLVVGLFFFAVVDSWGQSLYAVVSYAGNWRHAAPAVTGILGITALAPVVRSLALRSKGVAGKFKVPIQYLALAFALVLILALLTGLAFAGHGLAWGWNLPYCSTNQLPSTSPGGQIYAQWCLDTNSVKLNAQRLVQVAPASGPATPSWPSQEKADSGLLWGAFGLSFVLTWLFARTISFLNLSSLHTLYSARLIRAYQGASSQKRWANDADVTRADPDDDIAWRRYHPYDNGGPLHLINCTINCTESVETALESTTAKGLNFCLGPAGISYGRHHAIFASEEDSSVKPVGKEGPSEQSVPIEMLDLGDWVGVSGAAFTTGLGNVGGGTGTTLGTSLLCGLFNVRLGYWWHNRLRPSTLLSWNRLFPVQTYVADEFTASFHIIKRDRWYLSDGGHYENTAAYELIRRRVPFILLADCGADPDGAFDDLGNLARRVRVDFGAEIKFAGEEGFTGDPTITSSLNSPKYPIGTLDDIRPAKQFIGKPDPNLIASAIGGISDDGPVRASLVHKHATLAEVTYPGTSQKTLILVVKPGLTGDEPADLLNYQRNNARFPQQTTFNQFFDEAQWESYRELGRHEMDCILNEKDGWLKKRLTGK
jgi:hypothetical protein